MSAHTKSKGMISTKGMNHGEQGSHRIEQKVVEHHIIIAVSFSVPVATVRISPVHVCTPTIQEEALLITYC